MNISHIFFGCVIIYNVVTNSSQSSIPVKQFGYVFEIFTVTNVTYRHNF